MEAKPHGGGVVARLAGWHKELRRLVAERSDRSLEERVAFAAERWCVRTSVPVMARTLKALGLPRKKSR
ncbi:MAG TPA: hypothetical protein VLJ11_05565 [Bryobacteraceae bacterium]|nr:hypothetical protein [Bryobacteraceae bacterium]